MPYFVMIFVGLCRKESILTIFTYYEEFYLTLSFNYYSCDELILNSLDFLIYDDVSPKLIGHIY